jgi:hypothetical protein
VGSGTMLCGLASPLVFVLLCLNDLLCGGRCSLPVSFLFLSRQSFLESLVQIAFVCAKVINMRLSPGNDMISDAGIMVRLMG